MEKSCVLLCSYSDQMFPRRPNYPDFLTPLKGQVKHTDRLNGFLLEVNAITTHRFLSTALCYSTWNKTILLMINPYGFP